SSRRRHTRWPRDWSSDVCSSDLIDFVHTPRQFAERDQMTLEIADLKFVRLAHIQYEKIVAAIEPGFELARSDLRNLHIGRRSFFAANTAKFVIVDQFSNNAIHAAHRALGIPPQLELAEAHS